MRKGSALHSYMLGGKDGVVVFDGVRNKRSKKWIEFQEENEGKHILTRTQFSEVEGMRKSLEAHPRAMELLDDGVQETTIHWDIGGRACAGTPDVVKPKSNRKKRLVELKSCMSSNPRRFKWHAIKQGWFAQVDWYANGLERSLAYAHGPVDEVFIVAVESKAPWPVTVFQVKPSMLKRGREQWREWMQILEVCERTNTWPAYADGDVEIEDDDDSGLDWEAA
jgi:hypothetical protein